MARKKGYFERDMERRVSAGREADTILREMDRTTERMHRDTDSVMGAALKAADSISDRRFFRDNPGLEDSYMEKAHRGPDTSMLEGPGGIDKPRSSSSSGRGVDRRASAGRMEGESFDDWVNRIFPSNYRPNAYSTPNHMASFTNMLSSADYQDALKSQRLREVFAHPNITSVMKKGYKIDGYGMDRLNAKILDSDNISGADKSYWLSRQLRSSGTMPDYVNPAEAETVAATEAPVNAPETPQVGVPDRKRLDDEIGSFMTQSLQQTRKNMKEFNDRGGLFMFPEAARPQEDRRRPDADRNYMLQMMMMQQLGMQPQYPQMQQMWNRARY